jgi:hypothetical protein
MRACSTPKLPQLVGVSVDQARENGHHDDAQIEKETPILQIVQIEPNVSRRFDPRGGILVRQSSANLESQDSRGCNLDPLPPQSHATANPGVYSEDALSELGKMARRSGVAAQWPYEGASGADFASGLTAHEKNCFNSHGSFLVAMGKLNSYSFPDFLLILCKRLPYPERHAPIWHRVHQDSAGCRGWPRKD